MAKDRNSKTGKIDSDVNNGNIVGILRQRREGHQVKAEGFSTAPGLRLPSWLVGTSPDQFEDGVRLAPLYFAVGEFGAMALSAAFWMSLALLLTQRF